LFIAYPQRQAGVEITLPISVGAEVYRHRANRHKNGDSNYLLFFELGLILPAVQQKNQIDCSQCADDDHEKTHEPYQLARIAEVVCHCLFPTLSLITDD